MFITKRALSRRTILRGIGGAIALPFLDAMVPALSAAAKTATPRLGFLYLPNGVSMNKAINYWKPTAEGTAFELSPILKPLAAFREQMVIVSGLTQPQAEALGDGNGDHTRATATWLNGVHPKKTEGADLRAGTTADQIAADILGKDTALPSLELVASDLDALVGNCENSYSCAYLNTLVWRSPTTPLPMENNPRVVFERLFGDGDAPAQRRARLESDRSILDWVTEDMARLRRTLGSGDRARTDDYFDSVREVERRIQRAEEHETDSLPSLERPIGIPQRFDDHVSLLLDMLTLAYQADITRVFTFMFGREFNSRPFPEIGVGEPHHGLSHHRDDPEQLAKLAKINVFQTELFARFLQKLRSIPDGDGTLFDHSLFLFGGGLSNPNEHSHIDLPLLLVGGAGAFKGGRHVRYPAETPMSNLLLTVLDKVGVPLEGLGDSTGPLAL